jgi:polyphosphate kinase
LSSADWMNRNMFGRIELAWPVNDPALRQRIIDECLLSYLHDTQDAWDLLPDGTYKRTALLPRSRKQSAQVALMALYSAEPTPIKVKKAPVRRKSKAPDPKVVKHTKPIHLIENPKPASKD